MEGKSELLVHISAPTTRSQDNLYRALAEAYLAFEPFVPAEPEPRGKEARPKPSAGVPIYQSMESYGSFPSLVDSEAGQKTINETTAGPLQSFAGGSYSGRLAKLEYTRIPRQARNTPRSSLRSSGKTSSARSTLAKADEDALVEDTQLALQCIESQLDGHFSDTSVATSDDGTNIGDVSIVPESPAAQAQIETHLEQPTDPPRDLSVDKPQDGEANHVDYPKIDFEALEDFVIPPPPPVSVERPGKLPSQMTKYLESLAQQNSGRFKPEVVLRTLETDERGHWLIDCRSWPRHLQYEFWMSLTNDITSGRLGWGVTLHREETTAHALGIVRLYCWGELVEHMWILLWLASGGKISGTGSKFLDCADREVITVP